LETCPPGSLIFLSEQEASDYFHGLDRTILEWYEQHLDRYGNDTVETTGNEVANAAVEGAQLPASEPQLGENEVQSVVDEKSQPVSKQQDKPAVNGQGQLAAEIQPVAKE
jgi:cation transport regulator ChaB